MYDIRYNDIDDDALFCWKIMLTFLTNIFSTKPQTERWDKKQINKSEKVFSLKGFAKITYLTNNYRMRAIDTRGLYTFYPNFRKILILCTVSIQERFIIKIGLWWHAYGMPIEFLHRQNTFFKSKEPEYFFKKNHVDLHQRGHSILKGSSRRSSVRGRSQTTFTRGGG